jgi:hypothetical protein
VRRAAVLGVLAVSILFTTALALADSFTPVQLSIRIASVARRNQPLAITIGVSADASALDGSGPMYLRVKLASECGGTYLGTPGVVLLDKRLSPQPATGHAYTATAHGSGKPNAYGRQTVCVFLEESGDDRVYATSQAVQVNVSASCTRSAARYDTAQRALKRARRRRHGRARAVAHSRAVATRDRRAAARACGSGVPL